MLRSRRIWIAAGVVIVLGVVVVRGGFTGSEISAQMATATVERGPFRLTHVEAGEIRAARGEKVVAPRVRGELKIVHLFPEGERVEVGDLILQFDRSTFAQRVKNDAGELEQAKAAKEKSQAELRRRMAELRMNVEQRQGALELARISLQKAEYASPLEKEERTIAVGQAERALEEARTNLGAQEIINRVELANRDLRITHQQEDYDESTSDYERLSVRATRPGIVVYEEIRKRGTNRRGKVTEGDVVWGGTSLVTLPELDEMRVHAQLGEMDVHRAEIGMPVLIRLEAFPGPVFHGKISDIAPMANELEEAPNVQVFEMIIDIDERDDRLLPGMSTSVEIILQEEEDVLTIPLRALRRHADGTAVVRKVTGGDIETVEVTTGADNGLSVIIEQGLAEGDTIALEPPPL